MSPQTVCLQEGVNLGSDGSPPFIPKRKKNDHFFTSSHPSVPSQAIYSLFTPQAMGQKFLTFTITRGKVLQDKNNSVPLAQEYGSHCDTSFGKLHSQRLAVIFLLSLTLTTLPFGKQLGEKHFEHC